MADYDAIKANIATLATRHGVTMEATSTQRTDWEGDKDAAHYSCAFSKEGRFVFKIDYSVGSGIVARWIQERQSTIPFGMRGAIPNDVKMALGGNKSIYHSGLRAELLKWARERFRPDIADVLSCLAMEAECDMPFEEWASDFGYDADSRKALATYEACRASMFNFRKLFPDAKAREELAELCREL